MDSGASAFDCLDVSVRSIWRPNEDDVLLLNKYLTSKRLFSVSFSFSSLIQSPISFYFYQTTKMRYNFRFFFLFVPFVFSVYWFSHFVSIWNRFRCHRKFTICISLMSRWSQNDENLSHLIAKSFIENVIVLCTIIVLPLPKNNVRTTILHLTKTDKNKRQMTLHVNHKIFISLTSSKSQLNHRLISFYQRQPTPTIRTNLISAKNEMWSRRQ